MCAMLRLPDDAEHVLLFGETWRNWGWQACAELDIEVFDPVNLMDNTNYSRRS